MDEAWWIQYLTEGGGLQFFIIIYVQHSRRRPPLLCFKILKSKVVLNSAFTSILLFWDAKLGTGGGGVLSQWFCLVILYCKESVKDPPTVKVNRFQGNTLDGGHVGPYVT